ncbi:DUF1326 domain-containing protein [Halomonas sp. M4R1S46]|uniref:DUF1326 domain-containing protein n=1 Tax=Halomonas sp. M4R1S46 TaxID=2982692 RepID=UPI0021E49F1A|nr:DUF1326 domain-containing protein [Halomonas sp. M4R1S46]UYG09177.1 DUF1326 domain-containing protein [Halomonas sp. M4R1S46]
MNADWRVAGTYFEACTCKGACPCLFGNDPTEGSCDALVAWHIERGHFDDQPLNGLNLAMALHSPGNMTDGNWRVVVYVDQAASEAQHQALVRIFGGQAGGHPAMLAGFIGEFLGVESAPMDFRIEHRHQSLTIGDVASAALTAIEGQDGGEVCISGHPVAISPGNDLVLARHEGVSHRGHGLDWHFSDRTASYAAFQYSAV